MRLTTRRFMGFTAILDAGHAGFQKPNPGPGNETLNPEVYRLLLSFPLNPQLAHPKSQSTTCLRYSKALFLHPSTLNPKPSTQQRRGTKDCDGRALTPYIDAVNNLNEGRGFGETKGSLWKLELCRVKGLGV